MSNAQRRSEPATVRGHGRTDRFWAILGGVLAVSVVAVAVLGVAYGNKLLCGLGFEKHTCTLAAVQPPAGDSSDAAASLSTPSDDVQWQGSFRLAMDKGVELDGDQPTAVSGPDGNLDHGDLFYDKRKAGGSKLYTADHPLAVWSQGDPPTADSCADAISGAGVWSLQPAPGQIICVQSTGGQFAALKVAQVEPGEVEFEVTLFG